MNTRSPCEGRETFLHFLRGLFQDDELQYGVLDIVAERISGHNVYIYEGDLLNASLDDNALYSDSS
jgi:hypothetical protein